MRAESYVQNNIDRFTGFQDTYDTHRPAAPPIVADIIGAYLGRRPGLVVDVGCGTGLSSFLWQDRADRVLGVEPNDDMRSVAERRVQERQLQEVLSFTAGYSHQLPVEADAADVTTCSQSFHWMEPESTLLEFARVLRDGGVFAAYDCDWPPTIDWQIEAAYDALHAKADEIIARLDAPDRLVRKWDKSGHLEAIQHSGHFRYTKEIVFHHMEPFGAERLIGLLLSQGGLQTVFKLGSQELEAPLAAFSQTVHDHFGGVTKPIMLSYRMRIGIK
ncbi:class I SAM-dependent methyltransferase [Paenibacillus sp. 1P07SE]|uniref:class I SAM-dependent methyltransferase n=1 Tax=Paenibacillus sp. 1P07SE TaxID=3132209 RepID=UPI0039A4F96F